MVRGIYLTHSVPIAFKSTVKDILLLEETHLFHTEKCEEKKVRIFAICDLTETLKDVFIHLDDCMCFLHPLLNKLAMLK